MPWQLVFRPDGVRMLLYPGEYTIGRKDCGIVLPNDKSISRLHATLTVLPTPLAALRDNVQAVLRVVDSSRFGALSLLLRVCPLTHRPRYVCGRPARTCHRR